MMPSALKQALIKPDYNKGEKYSLDNNRPISILNSFSKVYEKMIDNRLFKFLKKFAILTANQHGFGKDKSIGTAFLNMFNVYITKLVIKNIRFQ